MEVQCFHVSWDSQDITISLSQNSQGSSPPAWVNFGWQSWQERGCHSVGQQVPTGLWWPEKTVYHCTYYCLDFNQPFKLHTDACGSGLEAVLYQTHEDGTDAVIAYASRSLTKAESHYPPTYKLEFLTLKWMVVKKFHEYLYGLTFNDYIDNNPLTYILTTAKLDATSHCWVASLANYNFQLYYWAGKTNIDADALLRVSWPGCMPDKSGTHLKVTAAAVCTVQEAALKGPQVPLRPTVAICTFWMQSRKVSRSPVRPWKTGFKPIRQIQPQVQSFLGCRMEPWGDDSPNRWIPLRLARGTEPPST